MASADETTTENAGTAPGHKGYDHDAGVQDVVFDFCGVLLDWRCRACLQGRFPDALVDDVCADDDRLGFFAFEASMDQGRSLASLLPEYRSRYGGRLAEVFRYYILHYEDSLVRIVPGMAELLRDLRAAGIGVWGLTNWSRETFPVAFRKFPELRDLLDGTVVSGEERRFKPNPDIYRLMLSRFGLEASRCVFVDDTPRNVEGARDVGMSGIVFSDAASTRRDLVSRGVPIPDVA
ncbi:HAD family phosphatase [uncultured Bifidobacterium sp.]|uniref:HAD family hydrolase n=1 Tax=uncultured Bifidobacterium sp. TaxID=165187 RepID=UPI0028DBAA0B|nr:HAD family phosphatase [uncultured Bifidobacterium sp.]